MVETTDPALAGSADWAETARRLPEAAVVESGESRLAVASAPLAGGGLLVALAPAPDELPTGVLMSTVLATASLWGLLRRRVRRRDVVHRAPDGPPAAPCWASGSPRATPTARP